MGSSSTGHATTSGSGPAPVGHNKGGLAEDEQAALTTYYALKIIEDQHRVAAKRVEFDSAKSVVNGHFKMIAKDLGFTREEFKAEVIDKLNMTDAEYASSERRRTRLHRLAGLQKGEQLDLLDVIADTVDEAMVAEADGYRAGRRADDPIPPSTISPILHQDWMRGYHAGQEFNGLALAKAAELLARPKPGQMAAGNDPDEEDGEGEGGKADVAAGAAALKQSGWVGPTEAEQQFEEADGGRTIRATRGKAQTEATH